MVGIVKVELELLAAPVKVSVTNAIEVGLTECLSGMKGNFHVPFLEEGSTVMSASYSPSIQF